MEVTMPVRGSFSKVGGKMLEVTVPANTNERACKV